MGSLKLAVKTDALNIASQWTNLVNPELDAAQFDASHDAYITTKKGRLLKVGRKLSLTDIIKAASKPADQDGLELRDGWCLELYAVPKEGATTWTEEMKRQLRG